jgi:hypothetical protein
VTLPYGEFDQDFRELLRRLLVSGLPRIPNQKNHKS